MLFTASFSYSSADLGRCQREAVCVRGKPRGRACIRIYRDASHLHREIHHLKDKHLVRTVHYVDVEHRNPSLVPKDSRQLPRPGLDARAVEASTSDGQTHQR